MSGALKWEPTLGDPINFVYAIFDRYIRNQPIRHVISRYLAESDTKLMESPPGLSMDNNKEANTDLYALKIIVVNLIYFLKGTWHDNFLLYFQKEFKK